MFKNRLLLRSGVLSLVIGRDGDFIPRSNTPTSAERGRAADATRWTAIGSTALGGSPARRGADTARWNAMAEHYQTLEGAQGMERSREAETARWTAMAEYYQQLAGVPHST